MGAVVGIGAGEDLELSLHKTMGIALLYHLIAPSTSPNLSGQ